MKTIYGQAASNKITGILRPDGQAASNKITGILRTGGQAAPVAKEEIFWVEYGTTTNAEINAAYQAGKMCFCKLDTGTILPMMWPYSATYHLFTASYNATNYVAICNKNAWSKVSVQLARASDIPDEASDIGAIPAPASASDGQFLVFRSQTGWGAETVPSASGVSF